MNSRDWGTIISNYRGSCQPAEEEEASEIDEKHDLNYRGSAAINSNYKGFGRENGKPLQFEFLAVEPNFDNSKISPIQIFKLVPI